MAGITNQQLMTLVPSADIQIAEFEPGRSWNFVIEPKVTESQLLALEVGLKNCKWKRDVDGKILRVNQNIWLIRT